VQLQFDSPDDGSARHATQSLGRKGRAAGFLHHPGGFAGSRRGKRKAQAGCFSKRSGAIIASGYDALHAARRDKWRSDAFTHPTAAL